MEAEDPLFILYTAARPASPRACCTPPAAICVYAHDATYVFDYRDGDVFWCTADVGWVTGHSYIVYGPLANGATTLMFDGVPNYPDQRGFWEVSTSTRSTSSTPRRPRSAR